MFTKYSQYSLLVVTTLGFLGCTQPRTISVNTQNRPIVAPPITQTHSTPAPIKEEVLIRNNPNLGNRVDVPKNNPTLGVKVATRASSSGGIDQLNGQIMERMTFPEDEYRGIKKIGRSTVSGKVYLINSTTEENVLGKGIKLYLNPVTSYSEQWYNESYLGGYKMSEVDRRLYNYLKFTTSNDSGEFDFYGIAQGDYYLIGSISCGSECGLDKREKIRLVKEVHVGSGVTKVELMKHVP